MKAVTLNPANSAGTRTGSRERELRILWGGVLLIFLIFLLLPLLKLFLQSFETEQGIGLGNYADVISQRGFLTAFGNSLLVSSVNALLTTALAFLLAYTIHYTNVGRRYKKILSTAAVVPMLLPTITYGFAIIYSFGKQGLLTQLFGTQLFDIYGWLIVIWCLLTWVPMRPGGFADDLRGALGMLVEPYLNLFRRFIPPLGGVDISPIVAILVLTAIERLVFTIIL